MTSPVPRAPSRRTTRAGTRGWPVLVAGGLALGAAALTVTATIRSLLGTSGPVLPYSLCRGGQSLVALPELTGTRLITTWQSDPVAFVLVAGLAVLYVGGLHRLTPDSRRGTWPRWRVASYIAGLIVVVLAVSSSIAVYDMTLFWAHMIQHLLLIMVAPALLVIGRPLTLLLAASGERQRTRLTGLLRSWPIAALTSPGVALAAYAAVIVGAHLTGLTDTVLGNVWAGQVEHIVYLFVGVLFFALVFGDEPIRWQLSMPGRMLLLMVAMAVDTFVGVVLLQANKPVGTLMHPAWGLSPIADVQAGGAVMWVGGDGLMAVMGIAIYVGWARRPSTTRTWSTFERARFALQAERIASAEPAPPAASPESPEAAATGGTAHENLDEDDRELEAYNRWLASLNRRG